MTFLRTDYEEIESRFHALSRGSYEIIRPSNYRYNCIALANDDRTKFWSPETINGYLIHYWPIGIARNWAPPTFAQLFQSYNYEFCYNLNLETGFEKVALYYQKFPKPTITHCAKQTPDGCWLSKLGQLYEIKHENLQVLEGGIRGYGQLAAVMRRPVVRH